jgi:nicotinate phosphoribosyltransferase
MSGDTVSLENDRLDGAPLVARVMAEGQRVAPAPTLAEIRAHAKRELETLPASLRRLEKATAYPVAIAESLRRLSAEADRRIAEMGGRW